MVDDGLRWPFDEDFNMLLEQSPRMPVDGEPDCVGAQSRPMRPAVRRDCTEEEPGECPDEFTIDENGDCRPNEPCSAPAANKGQDSLHDG